MLEATVHLIPDTTAVERGMITIYNPSSVATMAGELIPVNLYYANFIPGDSVTISDVTPVMPPGVTVHKQNVHAPSTHIVGSDGGGLFDVMLSIDLPPMSHAHFVIQATA